MKIFKILIDGAGKTIHMGLGDKIFESHKWIKVFGKLEHELKNKKTIAAQADPKNNLLIRRLNNAV